MFIDVCIPNNNEEEFIKIATALGTKGLLFLYDDEKREKENKSRIAGLESKTKLKLYTGFIAKKNINKPGVIFAKGEQQNIENKNMKFMYDFEELEQKTHFTLDEAEQITCSVLLCKKKKKF